MSDAQRCEPPEHLRGVDGWHWVEYESGFRTLKRWWLERTEWRWAQTSPEDMSYFRYLSPAAPPDLVRALVEALEGMQAAVKDLPPSSVLRLSNDLVARFLRADGKATAALAHAKEAGV
jgi:hypothetical protein